MKNKILKFLKLIFVFLLMTSFMYSFNYEQSMEYNLNKMIGVFVVFFTIVIPIFYDDKLCKERATNCAFAMYSSLFYFTPFVFAIIFAAIVFLNGNKFLYNKLEKYREYFPIIDNLMFH